LIALLDQMPTSEELAAIKAAKNPDIPYDKPENFALKLTEIPKVQERLKCWLFMKGFEERKKEIFVPLCRIKAACYQLKAYEPLKSILGLVLTCGNYLNGGTNRGQADGFYLSILPKLADTESTFEKNTTLLSYMVKTLYAARPTLLAMGALPELEEAGRVPFAEAEGGLNQLKGDVKTTQALGIAVANELKGIDTQFTETVTPFLEESERTMKHLETLFTETCGVFLDMLMYFGWPEVKAKAITNDKFFGELHQFMAAFTGLWKVEEAVEERKNFEKNMEKKARLEALASKKDTKDNKTKEATANATPDGEPTSTKAKLKTKFAARQNVASPTGDTPSPAPGQGPNSAPSSTPASVEGNKDTSASTASNLKAKFKR